MAAVSSQVEPPLWRADYTLERIRAQGLCLSSLSGLEKDQGVSGFPGNANLRRVCDLAPGNERWFRGRKRDIPLPVIGWSAPSVRHVALCDRLVLLPSFDENTAQKGSSGYGEDFHTSSPSDSRIEPTTLTSVPRRSKISSHGMYLYPGRINLASDCSETL